MTYAPEPIMPVLVLDGAYSVDVLESGVQFHFDPARKHEIVTERLEPLIWHWIRVNHQWCRWVQARSLMVGAWTSLIHRFVRAQRGQA